MEIGITQSQTLIASIAFSKSTAKSQVSLPKAEEKTANLVDVVEIGRPIDADFAAQVLQDSLEERLNAMLESAGVESTVADLLASDADFSPQATAGRIVDFAVGFYEAYQQNHEGEEGKAQLEGFVQLIKGAIEEGFAGAQELLGRLGDISGEIQTNIDETFDLTMKGIDDFTEKQRRLLERKEEQEPREGDRTSQEAPERGRLFQEEGIGAL